MPATLGTLREEHRRLLPHVEELRATAESVGRIPPEDLAAALDRCVDFLHHHLIPHARAEDDVLYPVVARLLGGAHSTDTMRRDHVEVDRLATELIALAGRVTEGTVDDDLRRVLFGLYSVIELHFAKEEEVYVPLLEERLTGVEADALMAGMVASHVHHERRPHTIDAD